VSDSEDLIVSSSRPRSVPSSAWRVFCALDISKDVRTRLVDHIQRLRESVPNIQASWSRADNIHLTLKFFGDVEKEAIKRLSAATARVVQTFSPFQIRVAGTGTFPKQALPRVLWVGIEDPSGTLASLQERFEDECAKEGFPKEERAFRPHLTLARIRKPQGSRALGEVHREMGFAATEVVVPELMLMRSELSSEGSKYTIISRHRFGGS
jgi:2'-5' RNA ligase